MPANNKSISFAAYSILFLNFYALSIFPFSGAVLEIVFYLQSLIFLILVSIRFDFNSFLKFHFGKIDFLKALFIGLSACVLYSFIYNIGTANFLSFFKIASYFYLVYIFSFCFVNIISENEKQFETFVNIVIIFVVINSVVALIFRMLGISVNPTYATQTLGLFNHPNTSSMLYVLAIPFLLYKYFAKKMSFELFAVILLLFLYSLLFTFSRAGYLGAGVGILLFTFFKSKKIFVITLSIVLLISFYFIIGVASSKTDSSIARILLALTAFDMISRSFGSMLWGYGVFNSLKVFQDEKVYFGNYESVLDPHNVFLLLGIQFGIIVSLLVLVICILLPFKTILKRKYFNEQDNLKIIFGFTVCISLLINNVLEDIIFYPEFFVMPVFLVFMGLLYKYNNDFKINQERIVEV